jgi:hypothetical protein
VEHDTVRQAEPVADEAERQSRVEENDAGATSGRELSHGPAEGWGRQKYARAPPLDSEILPPVENGRVRVSSRENRQLTGRQPAKELVEIRLNATDLGREVIGDENVCHQAGTVADEGS